MRSNFFFYCQKGHVFQHDSAIDESIAWDHHIPAKCKDETCDESQNLMGPFLDAEQADYVMKRRWK